MDCENLVFSGHAIQQMFFRRISKAQVQAVIAYGEIIEEYMDDQPLPSYLLLGFVQGIPLHVVLSRDRMTRTCYVITTYVPDLQYWQDDFRTRR